jgi:hypothetical protein
MSRNICLCRINISLSCHGCDNVVSLTRQAHKKIKGNVIY